MTNFAGQLDQKHEYRFNRWVTSAFLLFGIAFIAAACDFLYLSLANRAPSCLVLFVPLVLLGLYFLLLALRSRLMIYGSWILVRYALTSESARIGELVGYREVTRDKVNFTVFYRKAGQRPIAISHVFMTDDAFRQWIGRLQNLDTLQATPQCLIDASPSR